MTVGKHTAEQFLVIAKRLTNMRRTAIIRNWTLNRINTFNHFAKAVFCEVICFVHILCPTTCFTVRLVFIRPKYRRKSAR